MCILVYLGEILLTMKLNNKDQCKSATRFSFLVTFLNLVFKYCHILAE